MLQEEGINRSEEQCSSDHSVVLFKQ